MKKSLTAFLTLFFLTSVIAFAGSGPSVNQQSNPTNSFGDHSGQIIPGQYIVVLKNDRSALPRSAAEVSSIASNVGALPKNIYTTALSGFSGALTDAQVRALKANPAVDYIEPDRTISMYAQTVPWGISHINSQTAHSRGVTGSTVKVGVIDTGIDHGHPDLAANYAGGIDFVNGDNDPMDDNGHGTHVSGTIAAIDNNIGVLGVAPSVSLYGIKVLDGAGSGTFSNVIAGIDWAANNGMNVVNMSLGASSGTAALQQACDNAYASGVLICGAAGNDYGWPIGYPAKYSSVVAVTSIDQNNRLSNFSNVGPEAEVTAPGSSVYSTYAGGGYATLSGTSMATPHAAGVAALIWATGNYTSVSAVRNRLTSTCTDIGPAGRDNDFGYGIVNADAATAGAGNPAPVADFSGTPTSGCAALSVSFTDLSTNATSWSWDFGDGGTSTAQNPNHTYNNPGTYTVSLTATGAGGSNVNTKNGYITVNGGPTAGFSGTPVSGTEPLTVNFTDQSSGATSWSWDFGDGGTSTVQNPSHTYNVAGTYTVTQTVTNACGTNQSVRTNYITVNPCVTPTAGFVGAPTSGDYPLTVSFTDQSSNAASYSWDFGDGNTSTAKNPSNTYTVAGTYTVTQTVSNACGTNQSVMTNYITVTTPPCNPPVVSFTGTPTTGSAPMTVSFTDQTSNNPTSWNWDFGDGGTSTAQNPNYTYNNAGTYTVTLTATNACGTNQLVQTNYITVNTGPVAGEGFILSRNPDFSTDDRTFTRNETMYIKMWTDVVNFNDINRARFELKDNNIGDKDRQPLTNNFDNTYTASYNLANLPNNETSWTWKGEAKDNSKNSYKPTANITITAGPPPAPVADFSGTPVTGTEPLTVNFSDLSTNSPTSWAWDFGDGGTSTAQNPSHTYNVAGTYTVSMTATNAGGSNQMVKTNYITVNTCVAPVAGFSGTPVSGDYPLVVNFTDQSTNASTYSWDFGDGNTSTASNPSHTYTAAGTYTVSQTVTNGCGSNQSVMTNYITVTTPPCNPPVASFSGTPTTGNAPMLVTFTDMTTNSPTSWAWDFGDGGTSTAQNPSYTYSTAGTYTVSLTATNACGTDQSVMTNYITVNAGGPVTGEGFILSRNPDFSTDDRVFSRTETIYMKLWTDVVNFNDLSKNRWELKDQNKNKIRQNFTNNFDNTYTAAFTLANLPSNATSWTWKGEAKDNAGNSYKPSTTITVNAGAAGLNAESNSISALSLALSNYPNPFNPTTTISFTVPTSSQVSVVVYNINGREVETLVDGFFNAGVYEVDFDASRLASGIYFYKLTTGDQTETKKMLLLK